MDQEIHMYKEPVCKYHEGSNWNVHYEVSIPSLKSFLPEITYFSFLYLFKFYSRVQKLYSNSK
jgi:hypothetical protein